MNCPMMTGLGLQPHGYCSSLAYHSHCISTWSHLELQAMETCCLIPFCSVVH